MEEEGGEDLEPAVTPGDSHYTRLETCYMAFYWIVYPCIVFLTLALQDFVQCGSRECAFDAVLGFPSRPDVEDEQYFIVVS